MISNIAKLFLVSDVDDKTGLAWGTTEDKRYKLAMINQNGANLNETKHLL